MGKQKGRRKRAFPLPAESFESSRLVKSRNRSRVLTVAACLAMAMTSLWVFGLNRRGGFAEKTQEPESQQVPLVRQQESQAQAAASTQFTGPHPPAAGKGIESAEQEKTSVALSPPAPVPLESANAEIEALDQEAKVVATSLAERFPNSPDALRILGLVCKALRETAKAMECWEKAVKLAPDRPDLYVGLAALAEVKGQYDKAAEICNTGIARCVPTPALYRGLATALISMDRPGEAVASLQRAVEKFPKDSECHDLLGKAYAMANQPEKAKASYKLAIDLQPYKASSYYGFAMACAKLGLEEESDRSMAQFQKLDAETMNMQRGMAGLAYDLQTQRRMLAVTCAEAAMVYAAQRRFEKAEELLRRSSVLAPTDAACRLQLAAVLVNVDRTAEAIPICREAIDIEPKNARHHLALAEIYALLGRFGDASAAAKEAVDLEPGNADFRRILLQLQARR
jgi:tetratricopeptide (TPR) repeat protein